ncbi:MAG: hypothetical protein BWZ07_00956 [Alphaproteobacteria bacterium ADurb.BinA280]|nr:MAG: hypothetical protein BWZ07_00956 [Alphaproteobacteria bacterium ADurb.BinA280]
MAEHGVEIAVRKSAVIAEAGFSQSRLRSQVEAKRFIVQVGSQSPFEMLVDETGAAAGDIDELADDVGVYALGEVVQIEVEVIHAA